MRRRFGALALFLGLALGLPAVPGLAHGAFWDDDRNIHEANIDAIAQERVTRGCDPPINDQYCPDRPVPRDQMAAFLARALDLPPAEQDHFSDDDGNMFEDAINRIAEDDITRGCNPPDNTRYCPDELVPRDQMASFLSRALELRTQDPTPGGHDLVLRYSVGAANNPDQGSLDVFGTRAHQALHSQVTMGEDGWNIQQRILFVPVESGADFHLWLTADDAVGEKADECSDAYSCTVGDDLYINDDNFANATASWQHRPIPEYQRYVITHEVGHYLDFDVRTHYNNASWCGDEGRAPVMMQQSIDRNGCEANAWPLGWERDCVEETWLADRTDQGGSHNGQCPHDPS